VDAAAAKQLFTLPVPGHAMADAPHSGRQAPRHLQPQAGRQGRRVLHHHLGAAGGAKKGEHREEAAYGSGLVATAADNSTPRDNVRRAKLLRFDLATGNDDADERRHRPVSTSPVFSPDGKSLPARIVLVRAGPPRWWCSTGETGKTKQTFSCPDGRRDLRASPRRQHLITGTSMATAIVWELSRTAPVPRETR